MHCNTQKGPGSCDGSVAGADVNGRHALLALFPFSAILLSSIFASARDFWENKL